MKTSFPKNRKQIFVTDFKTPVLTGLFIWLLLMIVPVVYFWIKGIDILNEFQNTQNEILVLTVGIATLTTVLPIIGWQRVTVTEWENKLTYRNIWDVLRSKTREFKLDEMVSMETKMRPKLGIALILKFVDGNEQKVNLSHLKKGTELENVLRDKLESSRV